MCAVFVLVFSVSAWYVAGVDFLVELITEFIRGLIEPQKGKANEPAWVRWLPFLLFVLTIVSFVVSVTWLQDTGIEWLLPGVPFVLLVGAIIYRISKL